MSINLGSNIRVQTTLPLDAKYIAADNTARDAIAAGERYQGMQVFVTATGLTWQLVGGIANGNWTAFGVSSSTYSVQHKTASYTAVITDDAIFLEGTTAAQTITLYAASTTTKPLKLINTSTQNWTIARAGSDTILGETSQILVPGASITLLGNGTSKFM